MVSAAARALGTWGTAEDVPTLITVLSSGAVRVRHACLEALGKLKDKRAIDVVATRLLVASDRQVAGQALRTMGSMVETSVATGLSAPDVAVVLECCQILEAVGTKTSLEPLSALGTLAVARGRRDVADACQRAIVAINARGTPAPRAEQAPR
jgi:HEAT repeat protein